MKAEEAIVLDALDQPESERAAFLERACHGDQALRQQITELLRGYAGAGASLEDSPLAPAAKAARSPNAETRDYAPGMRIGRYKLLQKIGEGGCGGVYMAEQEEPVRRRVALKIIKLGMDTREVIARFEAERQALALMDHPHIARVLDAGATKTGRPFFVMELVRGGPITQYCDEHRLGTEDRIRMMIQLCSATQHAHQKGIIHRDLKPSNILVTLHDGVAVPKIIDFGIAKAMHGRLIDRTFFTAFDQFVGTPAYMSPEQMEMSGLDVDTRSDVYSLGVLLYELLTGRPPFDARDLLQAGLEQMRRTVRETDPAKPSTRVSTLEVADAVRIARQRSTDPSRLRSWLRGDLDWIVMRCLEKDRTRRYETASALANDLQRYLSHEPIVARPPSTGYILRKLVRRNKLTFAAATAALCALVTGLAIATVSYLRERDARQRADIEAARRAQVALFMQDMLAAVGPQVAIGRDTRLMRAILDQTVFRLNRELDSQPDVEAHLRETLGHVYRDLGEYGAAAAMHERAVSVRRKLFGRENPLVAASLHDLGEALFGQGKLPEAESVLREALALRERSLGRDHLETAVTRAALTSVTERISSVSTAARQASTRSATGADKPTAIHIAFSGLLTNGKPVLPSALNTAQQQRSLEREFALDGIRIEWRFYANQSDVLEAYARGVADFTNMGPVAAVVSRARGFDYKIVLALRRYDPELSLIVHATSPFRSLTDLRGHRLAVIKGSSAHLLMCRILAKHGLPETDFDLRLMDTPAAAITAFASGQIEARLTALGDDLSGPLGRDVRVVYDPKSDPSFQFVGKLCVSGAFERRYPEIAQRVVTTLVKAAAWVSDESNRTDALRTWATSPLDFAALQKEYSGNALKDRMSPLLDDYFQANLRRDIEDLTRIGLVSADADMSTTGWVEPKYLDQALRTLQLVGFWAERDANGKTAEPGLPRGEAQR